MNLSGKGLSKKVRRIPHMSKFVVIGILVLGVILTGVACGNEEGEETQGIVKATWIPAQVGDDTVSIPVNEVSNSKIVHFYIPAESGEIAFMAYDLNGNIYVRANVCPPCRSVGFSLDNDILVCDTCSTTFKANTGQGISGACVNYPKALVSYEVKDGSLIMGSNDLVTAYQNTYKAGLPEEDEETQGKVKATWIQARVEYDTVSILVNEVRNNTIVHFYVPAESGEIAFMAYDLNGNIYVRANVCPPCRSIGFSLDNDTLVCDTCSTTFQANTGEGISGACMIFSKASVSYEVTDGSLIMDSNDLVAAYQETIKPG